MGILSPGRTTSDGCPTRRLATVLLVRSPLLNTWSGALRPCLWLLFVTMMTSGCQRAGDDSREGLSVALSPRAIQEAKSLFLPTQDISRILARASACPRGARLTSASGTLIAADISCETVDTPGIRGTLRDQNGEMSIVGMHLDTLTITRMSGEPRLFESEGAELAGFRGAGAIAVWRWWSAPSALRRLISTQDVEDAALLILDGRSSGVVYPGENTPTLAIMLGTRAAVEPSRLREVVEQLASRLGVSVADHDIDGGPGFCLDGQGLLPGFAPCVVHRDGSMVVVAFNRETLLRSLADLGPPGPPVLDFNVNDMVDADRKIEGLTLLERWSFDRLTLTPQGPHAATLTVKP